jgi:hypothetical protein
MSRVTVFLFPLLRLILPHFFFFPSLPQVIKITEFRCSFVVLGTKPVALCMLDKYYTTELHHSLWFISDEVSPFSSGCSWTSYLARLASILWSSCLHLLSAWITDRPVPSHLTQVCSLPSAFQSNILYNHSKFQNQETDIINN